MVLSDARSESIDNVPQGYVRLVLVRNRSFYLQIPLKTIASLSSKPRKYLVYLGWCILGVEGNLVKGGSAEAQGGQEGEEGEEEGVRGGEQGGEEGGMEVDQAGVGGEEAHGEGGEEGDIKDVQGGEEEGAVLELDGDLDDAGVYYYDTIGEDLSHAVDLEVIKERSNVPSAFTDSPQHFRDELLKRDWCCVFTGGKPVAGSGMHIIPFRRGSEWLIEIVGNRPSHGEDVEGLNDINDIRNGLFVNNIFHSYFDIRMAVIMKTPNHILTITDIPQRADRLNEMPDEVTYPKDIRYSLHWLEDPVDVATKIHPNNIDATFKKSTRKPKPSDLLLHYNYGAAAVKWWGHGVDVLRNRPDLPRPKEPTKVSLGHPMKDRKPCDRDHLVKKLDAARGEGSGNAATIGGRGDTVDSEHQAEWDEDDVMLYLWGNSRVATERNRKKQEEGTRYMEQWRRGVPSTLV